MSSSVVDLVAGALDNDRSIRQIGQQLGLDDEAAARATAVAIPLLVGALARNASSSEGASALALTLDRDHDGSILNDLDGFLGGGAQGPGEKILRHILGDRRQQAQQGLGMASGVDAEKAGALLSTLAPVVMGAIGRVMRQKGLDSGGIGAILGQERQGMQRQESGLGGLGSILEHDGDGSMTDDVAKLGGSLLGSLLGGPRRGPHGSGGGIDE